MSQFEQEENVMRENISITARRLWLKWIHRATSFLLKEQGQNIALVVVHISPSLIALREVSPQKLNLTVSHLPEYSLPPLETTPP